MNLGFKKKQRQAGKGGQPLELTERAEHQEADKAADLKGVLGEIDQVLDETAKVERHCCYVERKW